MAKEKQRVLTVGGLKKLIADLPDTALVVMPSQQTGIRDLNLRPLTGRVDAALKNREAQVNHYGALRENLFKIDRTYTEDSVPVLVVEEFPWE